MFIRTLKLEEFQAHPEYFQALQTWYQSPSVNRLEEVISRERVEETVTLQEIPILFHDTIKDSGRFRNKPIEELTFKKERFIVLESAWVKGICECLVVCEQVAYENRYWTKRVLAIQIRRFSSLAALKHLKWTVETPPVFSYREPFAFKKELPEVAWCLPIEEATDEVLSFLQTLGLSTSYQDNDWLYFNLCGKLTVSDHVRYLLTAHLPQYGFGFQRFMAELMQQHTALALQPYARFLTRQLTRFYRDFFDLTGEHWNVSLRTKVKVKAVNEAEATQIVEARGYRVIQCSLYDSVDSMLTEDERDWFIVYGEREITLDHKFNDHQLTYYRHVIKKHLYDYYKTQKTLASFEIRDCFGAPIWVQDLSAPYVNPIPLFLSRQIQKQLSKHALVPEIDAWTNEILAKRAAANLGPDHHLLAGNQSLWIHLKYTLSPRGASLIFSKLEQVFLSESYENCSTFTCVVRTLFATNQITILTPAAKREVLLNEPLSSLYAFIGILQQLCWSFEPESVAGKFIRKSCSQHARRGTLTLSQIELILEEAFTNEWVTREAFTEQMILLRTETFKRQWLERLPSTLVSKVERRINNISYLKNILIRLCQKIEAHELKEIAKRFDPLFTSLTTLTEAEAILEQLSLFHDHAYVLDQLIGHPLITTSMLKELILNNSMEQLEQMNEWLTGFKQGYTSLEMKTIRAALQREIKKSKRFTLTCLETAVLDSQAVFVSRLNLTPEESERLPDFISRLQRYGNHLTLMTVVRTLGQGFFKACLTGSVEGLFRAQTFTYPRAVIGETIRQLVKTTDGSVSNPKRLYHKLRTIQPMENWLRGQFTDQEAEWLVQTVKQHTSEISGLTVPLKLTAKVEAKGSPEFLIAGNASVCCMSFGNDNAMQYAKEKGFGVLNIYYGDRIIGNSVLWLTAVEDSLVLVLDNVEIHPNYTRFNPYIKTLYLSVIEQLKSEYLADFVVQGANYNDLELFEDVRKKGKFSSLEAIEVSMTHFYSDAHQFYLVMASEEERLLLGDLDALPEPPLPLPTVEIDYEEDLPF